MITHRLVQGSPEWDQFRLEHDGASEAAAVLGLSLTTTRTELLHAKATGIAKEFSRFVRERVLDKGHETEASARPNVEALIGQDLYPVTCSEGRLSASCDGLTMDETIAFEHKQWNDRIAALVMAGEVPPEHMPQCQQVLMVTGAEKLIFVVSDGTPDKLIFAWVHPDPAWFDRIRAGWDQFAIDLAAYVPSEAPAPLPTARTMESLPALLVSVKGEVTESNLAAYREHAFTVLGAINRDLKTDEDFATAKATVKWCDDVEKRIAAGKEHILGQTQTIDAVFRTMDEISAEARRIRLDLDKLVTRREAEVKADMVLAAKNKYEAHIAACTKETGGPWITLPAPDFAGAIKGKRSLVLMQDALDTALANGKIAADTSARSIRANLACIATDGAGFEFLFNDRNDLIRKPLDDLKMLVAARITEHKAQKAREEEASRERIRQEEVQRLAAEQAAAAKAEEVVQTAAATPPPAPAPAQDAVPATPAGLRGGYSRVWSAPPASAPVAEEGPPTLRIGTICDRLPCTITQAHLAALGIQPAGKAGSGPVYRESQFPLICQALVSAITEAGSALYEQRKGEVVA